jgi:hypothetical protein
MTKPDLTLIAAVMDRSGSMMGLKTETEGGYNTLIKDQRELPGEVLVSLFQFDQHFDSVYAMKPIKDVPPLDLQPRGMTALLDAVGTSITETGAALAAMDEADRPGKVIFVIMTDGLENASQEWSLEAVKKLVKQQQDDYQWEFIFLGANIDAVATGTGMGFQSTATMDYAASNAGVQHVYAAASAAVSRSRSGLGVSFTKAERDAAMGGGNS